MARRSYRLGHGLAALAAWAGTSHAFDIEPAPPANLDFSNLGRIGIAGDFSGISLYEYLGQNGRPPARNGSESLLGMLPNGALATIASADATIRTMCTFMLSDGEMQGVVMGGNFTSLDGTESTAIALYNPGTGSITPLAGLEGEVNAIYCDQDRDTVYVGGNFRGANSTNAIAWYGTEGWTNLPFAGFNGPVEAITKASSGHIIFGGSFTGLGNASAPTEPDGQIINLSTANVTSINTADGSDPDNIVCSDGSGGQNGTWLVQDDTPGFWDAEFGFGFEPTKLRLWNTRQDGRGTKTFRFNAFPINGIMNLTYVDPTSGENKTCTSECPLSDDPEIEFQDFHFVNTVGMNRFQLAISDWYGAGAGLNGLQLFQDNIFSYAVANFNEPSCRGIDFPSTATATGPWTESPSLQSSSKYLTIEIDEDTDADSASVVFIPNIKESGNYTVNMYTPGCQPDATCEFRGRVNVTGTMSAGSDGADFTSTFYQTNNFDKYDQIYFGYIDKASDSFKPSVTISPIAGESIDGQIMVAQRIGFILTNSTGGLNGLFEFDPEKAVVETSDFEDSAINQLGASFDANTGVKAMVSSGDTIFIGGNFTSDEHVNIAAINNDDEVRPLDGGLNGQVLAMYINGSRLYAGGDFSNTGTGTTTGLSHIGVYDLDDDAWVSLGAGVNGKVQHVVPLQINLTGTVETAITFTGTFSQCNEFEDFEAISVNGFAVWVPSQNNWLQNIDGPIPSYSGVLTTALLDVPDSEPIYAGSISSAQMGVTGAATLSDDGLGNFPLSIQSQTPSSSESQRLRPRKAIVDESTSGIVTGMFHEKGDYNLTILAGRFTVRAGNDTTIDNLVIIDGNNDDALSGIGDRIDSGAIFVTVAISGNTLLAGGRFNGSVDDNDVSGIITYELDSKRPGQQPAPVSGNNGTVSVVSARPDSSDVFVGGSFTSAGSLDCPGICLYNLESSQWVRPGGSVGGDVQSLLWISKNELVVGGDLSNGTSQTSLAIYNPNDEAWEGYPGSEAIPGPVQVITPASDNNDQIWVCGRSSDDDAIFLMKYNGEEWLTANLPLSTDSIIRGLQVFSVTEDHEDNEFLDKDQVLMLTGSLGIEDFGMASAVLFNGTTMQPYALTTSSSRNAGSISKIFSQRENFFESDSGGLALVFIVLIGLAISLGLILLLVVCGILLDRLRKRREGYTPAPTSMYDRSSGIRRIPPRELLESLGKGRPGAPHV